MSDGESAGTNGTRAPVYVEAQRAVVRVIESRFTGLIVAGVTLGWLASAILPQFGYAQAPPELGRVAEVLLVAYVVKKAQQTNGNGKAVAG